MSKRIVSLLMITVLALSLLAACGGNNGALTVDEAKSIALKDMGVKESKVDSVDVHISTVDGVACYVVYISIDGEHMQYTINGLSGEILAKVETDEGHSH